MNNSELVYLGSHVSMTSPEFFLGSVKEAISYGANALMFYTGAPQNSYRVPLERLLIPEGLKLLEEAGIDKSKLIVHAPYIINPSNYERPDLFSLSINLITNEVIRTAAFGASVLVLHPGAHVGQGVENGIKATAQALDEVFERTSHLNVKIALETMAGKGTEIGSSFEQIREIIDSSKHPDRLGVCLDTCHISDAGYNISKIDEWLSEFDRIIGLNKLLVIHTNDSKNPRGTHKDRHENLGYGEIGFEIINDIVHHDKLKNVPKILETPYVDGKPPYKKEIEMLRSGKFEIGWREKL